MSHTIMDERRRQRWRLGAVALWLCSTVAVAEHYTVPLFVPAGTSGDPQGVLRILNDSDTSGTVTVYAIDDAGTRAGPATFTLNARAAAEFTATVLANGNATTGLTGSLGTGTGDWRLEIETDLAIQPLAYVRGSDGTLSVMHDTVRGTEVAGVSTFHVPIFNPSTNVTQASRIRLINPGDAVATVTIGGRDDTGAAASGGEVQLTIAANGARTLTAQQLEAGDASVTGRLGAGVGRWRLSVSADRPIQVVNVAVTTAGVWNNLSTTAVRGPAPADHGAFSERYDGLGVVYETDGGRYTLSPQADDRFTETGEADGMAVSRSGTYLYSGIGPDAGRLRLDYDDGNACRANFYFSSRTGGWFASHCTGSNDPDGYWIGGNWFVEEDEDGGAFVETAYEVNDALPGVPTSGAFAPAVTSGASVTATAEGTTIALDNGGYFELGDGTRYTCTAVGGCTIVNGTVTAGTVTGREPGAAEVDRFPSFRTAAAPGNQSYTVGTAIDALTLPAASGGNGDLTYTLSPVVPGLTFNASTRQLTGTPTTAASYNMTYTVTDEDGDADSLGFTIAVSADTSTDGSLGVCQAGMLLRSGQTCTYPGTGDVFSVNERDRGVFLTYVVRVRIRIDNETIDGRVYDFEASHQGDGVWRIHRVAGETEPPTGDGDGTDTGTGTSPAFASGSGRGNHSYREGTAIGAWTLPEATGGDGMLTYGLSPDVPGLSFDAETRELSGTPSEAGTYAMTYTVTDADGDTDTLSFTVTVISSGAVAEGDCYVGLIVSIGESCTYPGTDDAFSVNARGRGRFLDRLAGIRIRIENETIDGREYDFEASHQGDGVWRIDRVAGSTEPPTADDNGDGMETATGGGADMGTGSGAVAGSTFYATDAMILDLPAGDWFPDVTSDDAGVIIGDDDVAIEFNEGGYIEEGGYRYTCVGVDGCLIRDRSVQDGLIIQTSLTDHEDPPSIYLGGAEIADLPAGTWFPDVASDAGAGVSEDDVAIEFDNGGYIVEGTYRYTCLGVSGCLISNRTVLDGPIVQTPLTDQDNRPSTGGTARSGASSYAGGAAIADLPAGDWFPDAASDAEAIVEDGELAVEFLPGGHIGESGYRYTCEGVDGCLIRSRNVVDGPIVQTPVPVEEIPPATGSPASDRAALEALYHATGGANWRRNDNWLSKEALDQWFGVVTDGDGRVTGLHLVGQGLSGEIPPVLWQLDALQALVLGGNDLTGPLPGELATLRRLETLILDVNRLSGPIPPEIGNMHNLRRVDFVRTQLSGTIPWAMWERIERGQLQLPFFGTFIHGVDPPPKRDVRRVFSPDPAVNGNASHRSVAYYQGPLVWRQAWGFDPEEMQRPVLGRWAAIAVRIDHHIPEPPLVITRVLDSEGSVLVEHLAEAAPPTTANHGPSLWRTTYVFDLPGEFYQAGNQIVHVIDPDGELAETDESDNVTDPVSLYGVRLPPFRITFVPLHYPGEPAPMLDPASLMAGPLAFWPIADDYQAKVAAPVESVPESMSQLKDLVTALWNANADPHEFYHGVVIVPWTASDALIGGGLASVSGQTAVSGIPDEFTLAHELGHNFSLRHPVGCDWPDRVDHDYPYPKGGLGPYGGWDANWRRFVSAADGFSDIMCLSTDLGSVSDYSYRKALEFRLRTGGPVGATAGQPLGQGVNRRWRPCENCSDTDDPGAAASRARMN